MIPQKQLRFQKCDLFAAALVILIALTVLFLFLPGRTTDNCHAEIYLDGVLLKTVLLTEEQEFMVSGNFTNTITIRDGKIAITKSDCPGGDCMHIGFVGSARRSIVCLPNSVEIRIVPADADIDFVVR